MRNFNKRVRGAILASLLTALSGCIGSDLDEPLGSSDQAMTLAEIEHLFVHPEILINAFAPGSDWAREGFLNVRVNDRWLPVRFLPTRRAIVVESVPGSWGNPFWLYAAILPHPKGLGLYVDEFGLVTARAGKTDQPHAVTAYRQIGQRFSYRQHQSGLEYMQPQSVEDVAAAYIALAQAGLQPQATFPLKGQ